MYKSYITNDCEICKSRDIFHLLTFSFKLLAEFLEHSTSQYIFAPECNYGFQIFMVKYVLYTYYTSSKKNLDVLQKDIQAKWP